MSWALLFPGQGSQRPGMLRSLAGDPAAAVALRDVGAAVGPGELDRLDGAEAQRSTAGAQLALFVAELAARATLPLTAAPGYVAGHSIGAWSAAVDCGAVTAEEGLRLVRRRGQLMASLHPDGFGMAAVIGLPERNVRRLAADLSRPDDPLYVAIVNAADQIVLSGSDAALARLEAAGGGAARRLAVASPSHCPLLDEVIEALEHDMASLPDRPLRHPYLNNSRPRVMRTGREVLDDLARSPSRPLRWADGIALLYELGVRLFVEVGPGDVLTRLVRQNLPDVRAISVDNAWGDLTAPRTDTPPPIRGGQVRESSTIDTTAGRVAGRSDGELVRWLGIPYAAPPVDRLRFRPPQPVQPWGGVRAADTLGPSAWQSRMRDPFTGQMGTDPYDEDCLYLNVTAPDRSPVEAGGFPVLVNIHGGGYASGSGAGAPVADGAGLARQGIVVVTFNYRLGALGFLDLAEVLGPDARDSGSAGTLDQIAALRWVRDNIAGVGGDPERVTIYGISAGAKSVANILASPLGAGLAHQAISSSGGGEHVATRDQSRRLRARFLRELGLDPDGHGVESVPPEELIATQEAIATGAANTWVWRPALGTSAVPVRPIDAIAAGAASGIALLAGNNGNEGATYQFVDPTAAEQAEGALTALFGEATATAILDGYRQARPGGDASAVGLAVLGDERYGLPTKRLARAQARYARVWRYRYDGCPPGLPDYLRAAHGIDSLAVWTADAFGAKAASGDSEAELCLITAAMIADFTVTGTPRMGDGTALPAWPTYDSGGEPTMILDTTPHVELDPNRREHDAWPDTTWLSGTWWPIDGL